MNTEKFARTAQTGTEIGLNLANTLLAASERLAAHNLNTARGLIADSVATLSTIGTVRDIQGLIALQTALVQPSIEKAIAYSRGVQSIASETQSALSHLFDSQYAAANQEVLASIDEVARHAPAGSEAAVGIVRQAIGAAGTAYDNVSKATRQAVEMTENNVNAATEAALKTVSINAARAKKAA